MERSAYVVGKVFTVDGKVSRILELTGQRITVSCLECGQPKETRRREFFPTEGRLTCKECFAKIEQARWKRGKEELLQKKHKNEFVILDVGGPGGYSTFRCSCGQVFKRKYQTVKVGESTILTCKKCSRQRIRNASLNLLFKRKPANVTSSELLSGRNLHDGSGESR